MYQAFYGLKKKPFQITTDPSFLWLGPKHKEALAIFEYGLKKNKGFLLLTGDVGTGKTTLVHALINRVEKQAHVAKISDPGLSRHDFYGILSRQLGFDDEISDETLFIECFTRFLITAYKNDKKVLLIIDESQRMTHDMLKEIRLLSSIEKQDTKLLTIFFVGQNEFNSLLLWPENRALRKRVAISYYLDPLNEKETGRYIRSRLKTAGAKQNIFSAKAVKAVYDISCGWPRQINVICDLALLMGFQASRKSISKDLVQECRDYIIAPAKSNNSDIVKSRQTITPCPEERKKTAVGAGYFREIAVAAVLLIFIGVTGYLFL